MSMLKAASWLHFYCRPSFRASVWGFVFSRQETVSHLQGAADIEMCTKKSVVSSACVKSPILTAFAAILLVLPVYDSEEEHNTTMIRTLAIREESPWGSWIHSTMSIRNKSTNTARWVAKPQCQCRTYWAIFRNSRTAIHKLSPLLAEVPSTVPLRDKGPLVHAGDTIGASIITYALGPKTLF